MSIFSHLTSVNAAGRFLLPPLYQRNFPSINNNILIHLLFLFTQDQALLVFSKQAIWVDLLIILLAIGSLVLTIRSLMKYWFSLR